MTDSLIEIEILDHTTLLEREVEVLKKNTPSLGQYSRPYSDNLHFRTANR